MIDLRDLRQNPDVYKASQRARGEREELVDEIIAADERHRQLLADFEAARSEQKTFSRQIGKASPDERPALLERAGQLSAEVKALEADARTAEAAVKDLNYRFSNLIVEGVPSGGEDDYVVLKHVGEPVVGAQGTDGVRDHLDLATALDIIDMERGAKVSGSRFYFLKGWGARLELAIMNAAMDLATSYGFVPMITPTLVSPQTMSGTGFLGDHAGEVYHLPEDDLYLTGTSEVALAGYHGDEILDLSDGPIRYAGWSACYRREAGSHGKDTKGIIRVHQFHKVEMFVYTTPDQAAAEHDRLLAWEEEMLAKIDVPYRVIDTAAGDLGASAARKFDIEAWVPSQQTYRELTSTSNCTTFQARRLGARFRGADGKTQPVATLNGTLATTRWIVALLENHQQPDGSINIPEGLRPYLGGLEVLKKQ